MEIIFENKVVEKSDIGNRMRFPGDANMGCLPPACSNDGKSLTVEDEEGARWELTCQNQNGKIYFTKGWKDFSEGRGIRVGHRISFYKDDDSFGSGVEYKIKVMKN